MENTNYHNKQTSDQQLNNSENEALHVNMLRKNAIC